MNKFFIALLLSTFSLGLTAQDSLNCSSIFNWSDESLVPSTAHFNTYNEIWGIATEGREYAIIGSTAGTHIFDVTDPENSEEIHFVEGAVTGGSIVHRDFHDYQGYLYICCDEGNSTLQIVDISNLPESVEVVYDSNELFSRAHNLFIDETKGILYAGGGSQQLKLFNLQDPTNPELILNCQTDFPGWSEAGYIHDLYAHDGVAYCNAGNNGLFVVDFNDVANPSFLGSLVSYTDDGYNHSGWLNATGDIYALADENHGARIKILDVSDPTDINEVSLITSGITETSIPHNLIFEGNYLHISYYFDGYYVYDLSDPANPILSAFYDTSTETNNNNYRGCWGVYPFLPSGNILASDMQNGLYILNPQIDDAVSVDQVSNETSWNVSPTLLDANNLINITGLTSKSEIQITVINELGQPIYQNTSRGALNVKFQLNNVAHGLYFVRLKSDDNEKIFKVVK